MSLSDLNTTAKLILEALNTLQQTVAAVFPLSTLSASKTWNPPNVADQTSVTTTVTVPGAVLGRFAVASFSLDITGLGLTAYISAADTVTVVLSNQTGGDVDLASGTLAVRVFG